MDPQVLEEFKHHSELMRSYLTLVVSTVTLALGATSGVIAYLVKSEGETTPLRRALALLPPAALGIGLGAGFLRQRGAAAELRDRLIQLAHQLEFGLAPHGGILVNALTWLGSLLLLTGGVLLIVAVVTAIPGTRSRKNRSRSASHT